MRDYILLTGRILVAAIFLVMGFVNLFNFGQIKEYMAQYGMPFTGFLLVCAIILMLVGSISIIIGYRWKWGAAILVVFLIPATLIFHTDFGDQMQQIHFLKNIGLLGGLMLIWASGVGRIALEKSEGTAR